LVSESYNFFTIPVFEKARFFIPEWPFLGITSTGEQLE